MAFRTFTVVALGALLAVTACQTSSQRKAAEREALRKRATAEIDQICALHGTERQAALDKLKAESGMSIYCASD